MLAVKFSRVQTQPTPNASSAAAPAAGARQVLLPGAWGSWAAAGPGGQPQGWPQAEGWLRVAGAGTGVAPLQKEPQGAPKSAAKRRVRKARSTAGSGAPSAADEGRHGAGGDAWTPAGAGRALPPRGAAASVTSGGSDGSGGSQQPQQQQHQAEQAHGLRQDDVVQGGDALALPSTKAGVPSTPAPGAAGGGKRLSAGASDKQPRQRSLKAAKRNARASPGTVALQHEGATQRTHSGASTGSGDSPEAPSRLAGSGASAPGEEGMASLWGERGALSGQAAGPSGQQQQQQQELQPAAPAGGRPAPRPGRREVPLPFFVKSSGANGGQRGRTPPPPAGGGATAGASLSGMARSASLPAPAPAAAQPKAIAAAVAGAPRAAAPIRLGSGDREGGEVMQGVVHQDGAAGPLGASGNVMVTAAGPLGKADGRPPLALRPTAAATAPFVLPDPELTKLFALGDSWLGPEASRNAFGVAWSLSCLEGPSGLGASLLPALLGHSQHQQQQQTVKQCAETRAGASAGAGLGCMPVLRDLCQWHVREIQGISFAAICELGLAYDRAHLLINSPRRDDMG